MNAAGQEIPPVASNNPAPTAATSSSTNVARKKPAALANGNHSPMAAGESGRACVIKLSRCLCGFIPVLHGARRDTETRRQLHHHDHAHDANQRVMMDRMGTRINDFPTDN